MVALVSGKSVGSHMRWFESAIGYAASVSDRIDRGEGVIRGVRVIGTKSRNGHDYLESSLVNAIPLYEGAKICINHIKPKKGEPVPERQFEQIWGTLRNVRWEGDGLVGDIYYIKSHQLTEQILEAAERFPENFGLSHDADGIRTDVAGRPVISKITKVYSVDIVADPASNVSLFESIQEGFCPTGKGGGRKNSCSSRKGSGAAAGSDAKGAKKSFATTGKRVGDEFPKLKADGSVMFGGKKLAFKNMSTRRQVYTDGQTTVAFNHADRRWEVVKDGSYVPVYAANQKGIVFDDTEKAMGSLYKDGELYMQSNRLYKSLKTGEPTVLFSTEGEHSKIFMNKDGVFVDDSGKEIGRATYFDNALKKYDVAKGAPFPHPSNQKESLAVSGSLKEGFTWGGQVMGKNVDAVRLFEEAMSDELLSMDAGASAGMGDEMLGAGAGSEAPIDEGMMGGNADLASAFKSAVMAVLDDDALDTNAKFAKIKAILKARDTAMAAIGEDGGASGAAGSMPGMPEGDGEEYDEENMQESANVSELQRELNAMKKELELRDARAAMTKLLESSNRDVTDVRVNALLRAPESERKALLDTFPVREKVGAKRPGVSPSVLRESAASTSYPKSLEELRQRLG